MNRQSMFFRIIGVIIDSLALRPCAREFPNPGQYKLPIGTPRNQARTFSSAGGSQEARSLKAFGSLAHDHITGEHRYLNHILIRAVTNSTPSCL